MPDAAAAVPPEAPEAIAAAAAASRSRAAAVADAEAAPAAAEEDAAVDLGEVFSLKIRFKMDSV